MSVLVPGLDIQGPHPLCGDMPKSVERVELSMLAYACDLLRKAGKNAPQERRQDINQLHIAINQLVIAAVRDSLAAEKRDASLSNKRTPKSPAASDGADILAGPELFSA